ncbi:tail fiber protein [Sphingomonas sp. HITSZ_GF]|uniref:phage tail protein n=1 Tax=Sphingomonas sp. HITSZ_GF TaxID=3037247 RepID=UPI00240D6840|nr:tail fiber protein [Sphingomonas sp. HITSZ_GF]MDG2535438.1 tail fiber protein [Sphingomonas sp. HITSZ_GF]
MMRFHTMLAAAGCTAALFLSPAAQAQEKYLGEIYMVGFSFCPVGSMEAMGQIVPISSNQALYALYGTTFGGDGKTNFALPDLRGRSPLGQGSGSGLSPIAMGSRGGAETVALSIAQMPAHTHSAVVGASAEAGTQPSPTNAIPAFGAEKESIYAVTKPDTTMSSAMVAIGATGSGQPVAIRSPYLAIRFCVVTQGIFPPMSR